LQAYHIGSNDSLGLVHTRFFICRFLRLPLPLLLPSDSRWVDTQRQYEAKLPTYAKRRMSPTSNMIVMARIVPMPGSVSRQLNASLSFTCF